MKKAVYFLAVICAVSGIMVIAMFTWLSWGYFWTIFFLGLFSISLFLIIFFEVYIKKKKNQLQQLPPEKTIIKENTIITEIVYIICPYCHAKYKQTETKCPNCGGAHY